MSGFFKNINAEIEEFIPHNPFESDRVNRDVLKVDHIYKIKGTEQCFKCIRNTTGEGCLGCIFGQDYDSGFCIGPSCAQGELIYKEIK